MSRQLMDLAQEDRPSNPILNSQTTKHVSVGLLVRSGRFILLFRKLCQILETTNNNAQFTNNPKEDSFKIVSPVITAPPLNVLHSRYPYKCFSSFIKCNAPIGRPTRIIHCNNKIHIMMKTHLIFAHKHN